MRLPRFTTRRLMLAVAGSALAMAATIHGGDRPGAYVAVGRFGVGCCRNDAAGRPLASGGRRAAPTYELGVWGDRPFAVPLLGIWRRGGWAWGRFGDWSGAI